MASSKGLRTNPCESLPFENLRRPHSWKPCLKEMKVKEKPILALRPSACLSMRGAINGIFRGGCSTRIPACAEAHRSSQRHMLAGKERVKTNPMGVQR